MSSLPRPHPPPQLVSNVYCLPLRHGSCRFRSTLLGSCDGDKCVRNLSCPCPLPAALCPVHPSRHVVFSFISSHRRSRSTMRCSFPRPEKYCVSETRLLPVSCRFHHQPPKQAKDRHLCNGCAASPHHPRLADEQKKAKHLDPWSRLSTYLCTVHAPVSLSAPSPQRTIQVLHAWWLFAFWIAATP